VVGQKIEKILEGQSVQPVKVKDQPKAKKINFFRKKNTGRHPGWSALL
jgi:hypothetical protein